MPRASFNALTGLLIAAPVVAFPFGRTYIFFCALIILLGLASGRTFTRWGECRGLQLGSLAIGLPIIITTIKLGIAQGHIEHVWLEKLGLVVASALLGFSVYGLLLQRETRRIASTSISLVILFWLLDGFVQLLFGADLFGITPSLQHGPPRVASFFSNPTRYGYFIAFLTALPAFWLLSCRSGHLLAPLALLLGGAVSMAGGSRFAMACYGLLSMFFMIVMTMGLSRRWRFSALLGAAVALLALATTLLIVSPSFFARVADTTLVFSALDRDTVNLALSYRLDIWEPAVALAADNWLFGVGPGEFRSAIKDYLSPESIFVAQSIEVMHAHQIMLEILVGTGTIGLVSFLAYYLWLGRTVLSRLGPHSSFGWGCLIAVCLMWLPIGSQKNFYGSEQMLLSFYLLALGFAFPDSSSGQAKISGVRSSSISP